MGKNSFQFSRNSTDCLCVMQWDSRKLTKKCVNDNLLLTCILQCFETYLCGQYFNKKKLTKITTLFCSIKKSRESWYPDPAMRWRNAFPNSYEVTLLVILFLNSKSFPAIVLYYNGNGSWPADMFKSGPIRVRLSTRSPKLEITSLLLRLK
mgnify:CR=1 FL=1